MTRAGMGRCAVALCWGMVHALAAAVPSTSQAQPTSPLTPPPGGTITINDGATHTNSAAVSLALSAGGPYSTATRMAFSNDGANYTAPEPYAMSKSWTLAGGDGEKTVYVKFGDANNVWLLPVSDTIILDTLPPTVAITSPDDGQLFGAQ